MQYLFNNEDYNKQSQFDLQIEHSKYNMSKTIEQHHVQFEISLNGLRDQILHKHMIMQKIQHDFNVKIGNKISNSNHQACEIIKFCRKSIEEIQRTLVDVKSYFIDLNLLFLHQFFSQVFKIMIISYKAISQRFMIMLKQKTRLPKTDGDLNSFNKNTEHLLQQLKNKKFSQLQYLDSLIHHIEIDERRLNQKKRILEENMGYKKQEMEDIQPSDAVNQLQYLKIQLDRLVLLSTNINQQNNLHRTELALNNSLKRSEQIQQEFCDKVTDNIKQLFLRKMIAIVNKLYSLIRTKQKQYIIKQIEFEKPESINVQVQTQDESKLGQIKDKSLLHFQNEQLKKTNAIYKKQKQELAQEIKQMQKMYEQLDKKVKIAQDLINKKSYELQKVKADCDFNLTKKDSTIEYLNKRISIMHKQKIQMDEERQQNKKQTEFAQSFCFHQQIVEKQEFLKSDNSSSRIKNYSKGSLASSPFLQRQYKVQKKQNNHLRRSLMIMLDTLQQQKLILQYPVSALNNDLRFGKLIEKIQKISIELLNKVKELKSQDSSSISRFEQKNKQANSNTDKNGAIVSVSPPILQKSKLRYQTVQKKDFAVQTQNFKQKMAQTLLIRSSSPQINSKLIRKDSKNEQTNLQLLKKQLLDRVNLGISRKKSALTKRNRIFINQSEGFNNANSNSHTIDFYNKFGENKENRKQKSKLNAFVIKDISFEQLKIKSPQNKNNINDKKSNHQVKKSEGNLKKILNKRQVNKSFGNQLYSRQNYEYQQKESLIIDVQSYERVSEVKRIMSEVEKISDSNQIIMKRILKKLLQQIRKTKGKGFFQQIVRLQEGDGNAYDKVLSRESVLQ